jgi:hypothetical protein
MVRRVYLTDKKATAGAIVNYCNLQGLLQVMRRSLMMNLKQINQKDE